MKAVLVQNKTNVKYPSNPGVGKNYTVHKPILLKFKKAIFLIEKNEMSTVYILERYGILNCSAVFMKYK
jgi:hypothetical protein